MLITILEQKYKVGCERGLAAEEQEGIFARLNSIIEWDKCTWPEDKDKNPNTKYLGDDPVLKSGDCFFYDGNVIALDRKDRLVLVLSETGPGAIQRICNEIINAEFDLLSCVDIDDIDVSTLEKDETVPDTHKAFPVPFYQMRLFHEKYSYGRIEPGTILKCDVNYFVPFCAYISDWKIHFNLNEIEEDMVEYLTKEILGWFYSKFERNLPPKPEEEKEKIDN